MQLPTSYMVAAIVAAIIAGTMTAREFRSHDHTNTTPMGKRNRNLKSVIGYSLTCKCVE